MTLPQKKLTAQMVVLEVEQWHTVLNYQPLHFSNTLKKDAHMSFFQDPQH